MVDGDGPWQGSMVDYRPWTTDHRLSTMDHGLDHGPSTMGHGRSTMDHGSWAMGHRPWIIGHGLWAMDHGHGPEFRIHIFYLSSRSPSTTSCLQPQDHAHP